jgi:hypothetical protein
MNLLVPQDLNLKFQEGGFFWNILAELQSIVEGQAISNTPYSAATFCQESQINIKISAHGGLRRASNLQTVARYSTEQATT